MIHRRFDVIVLGLGAMGSAAAYNLSRRGRRVLGLDRFHPPHRSGSSHGHTRAIRKAYFEDPAYVPLLHRAYNSWRRLETDSGQRLFYNTGALMLGPADSPVVAGSIRSAREHGLRHEVLDSSELTKRFPPLLPDPDTVGVLEDAGGVLPPERCIRLLLEGARASGAELRFDEPAESWRELPGEAGVEVATGRGLYQAERLVLAAGAWSPQLLEGAGSVLSVSRQVLFWLRPSGEAPRFQAPNLPFWVWAPEDERVFYGFPIVSPLDAGVKLGIHSPGRTVSAHSDDREVEASDLEELRLCIDGRIRGLEPEPFESCVCLYTNTPDGHFLLGSHPHHPSVIVATGFSGHGFKFTALFGEVVADLAIEGTTELPIGIFDPGRDSASWKDGL